MDDFLVGYFGDRGGCGGSEKKTAPVICSYTKNELEETPIKVTYREFTGELVKLERTHYGECRYSLSVYDSEKSVTHSFTSVKLEDVKFLGGVVVFGG